MLYKKEIGWKNLTEEMKKKFFVLVKAIKNFLDIAKTEREFVTEAIKVAEKNGFKNAEKLDALKPGDKVYYQNRGKNIALAIIGTEDILNGLNIVASHVDAPRLDLKQHPLYEDADFALLKTHYYGGIKKYQWGTIPLALHGVVILSTGEKVNIVIGEDENDPVFTIPDLLPHLDRKVQRDRKASEVLKGEELNLIVGSIPATIEDGEVKELVKYNVLKKLNETYKMIEEDFISAEFEVVPAHKAKDVGFDRGIVGAYGHDDRICGYTSLKSILDIKDPKKTAICFIVDKEEIGSTGSTGLRSEYIEYFVADMISKLKGNYNELMLKKTFWNSRSLSSDVSAAVNPLFKSVHDMPNACKIGFGIAVNKYTGAGGKGGSNDADAEYVAEIRQLFNQNDIKWQTAMLGKVDEGGGGTVAMFLAHLGIKTIDAGPGIVSMHSPFELASKYDIYECYKAYKVFYER